MHDRDCATRYGVLSRKTHYRQLVCDIQAADGFIKQQPARRILRGRGDLRQCPGELNALLLATRQVLPQAPSMAREQNYWASSARGFLSAGAPRSYAVSASVDF